MRPTRTDLARWKSLRQLPFQLTPEEQRVLNMLERKMTVYTKDPRFRGENLEAQLRKRLFTS